MKIFRLVGVQVKQRDFDILFFNQDLDSVVIKPMIYAYRGQHQREGFELVGYWASNSDQFVPRFLNCCHFFMRRVPVVIGRCGMHGRGDQRNVQGKKLDNGMIDITIIAISCGFEA